MRRFSILVLLIALSACSQVVYQKDLAKANLYCKDKMGVFSVRKYLSNTHEITCRDGTKTGDKQ